MSAISVRNLSKTYPIPFQRLRAFFRRPVKDPVEALRDAAPSPNSNVNLKPSLPYHATSSKRFSPSSKQ